MDTDWTDSAGSALDYLEEFGNSFIIISDNQSSYPAHSLMIENFCTTGLFIFYKADQGSCESYTPIPISNT